MIVWCGNLTILLSGLTFHCFWYRKQKTLCDSLHRPSRSDFVQSGFMGESADSETSWIISTVFGRVTNRTDPLQIQIVYSMELPAILLRKESGKKDCHG